MPVEKLKARNAAILALVCAVAASCSHVSAAERVQNITFDDIKFDLKFGKKFERSMLGKGVEALNGKPVRVRGFIHPMSAFQLKGLTQFVLVRDDEICCFGPGAALCDSMQVEMDPGTSTGFTSRLISVEGVFSIRQLEIDGKTYSIYHLQAKAVK